MLSGGDYAEVGRWVWNTVTAHARRAVLRAEAEVDTEGPREGTSYGVRVVVDGATAPPAGAPPLELTYAEVAANRWRAAWCAELAGRARELARAAEAAARARA